MNKPHLKHAKLPRPSGGTWGRAELALVGAPCSVISALAQSIAAGLNGHRKTGFADAAHGGEADPASFAVQVSDKPDGRQLFSKSPQPPHQQRYLLNDCDLVLVNGNHFKALQQIVILHPAKSLREKTEALTDVRLILRVDSEPVPEFLYPFTEGVPVLNFGDTEGIISFITQFLQLQEAALNGLVLAGGQSTRMGSDKGALQYHGLPQRDHAFNLLQPLCREVYISCNAAQRPGIDLPLIEDSFLGLGPLGGILSAFRAAPDRAWLTVACDMPLVGRSSLEFLIAHRDPSRLATAYVHQTEGFPEPLLTIWEPRAYPVLLQALATGVSCPRKVLMASDVLLLQAPDSGELQNVNDPDAYHTALHSIARFNLLKSK